VLAEKAGVSIEGVRMYRKRHGIALEPSARQPRGRKAKKAPVAPPAVVAPAAAPKRRKRRSKLDPFRDVLGVRPDRELAEKAGVSLQAVRQYRRRHDIGAPPRGGASAAPAAAKTVAVAQAPAPAPAPAPAASAKPTKHFGYSVSVRAKDGEDGENGEEIYFLIATDIILAATQASQSAGGRVVSIKQLGPALA
jgi:pyruvate/2-oxoglutarate dehydrogenase complex dihydrolipoamide acyltransferase (E2) component